MFRQRILVPFLGFSSYFYTTQDFAELQISSNSIIDTTPIDAINEANLLVFRFLALNLTPINSDNANQKKIEPNLITYFLLFLKQQMVRRWKENIL